jgi:hypothetical protein
MQERPEKMESKDLFLEKLAEIRSALKLGLYDCALALSLTLPDMCGKVEYPGESSKRKRYKDWFSIYAEPLFTMPATKVPEGKTVKYTWLTGEECWALRCSVLHAGDHKTKDIKLSNIKIHASKGCDETHNYMFRDSQHADWETFFLCENLCCAAEQYYQGISDKTRFAVDGVRIDA